MSHLLRDKQPGVCYLLTTMRKQRYFPSRFADQVRWLLHFLHKLPAYAELLALTEDELADACADAGWAAYLIGPWQFGAGLFPKAATAALRHGLHGTGDGTLPTFTPPPLPEGIVPRPAGALDRLFHFIAVLKLRHGFTKAIARDLGIFTLATPAPALPRFLLRVESGPDGGPVVVITFFKYGRKAVTIETRTGDGPTTTFCPIIATPYCDPRPLLTPNQPERRSYRLRFFQDDAPIGDWTPWRQIVVGPG